MEALDIEGLNNVEYSLAGDLVQVDGTPAFAINDNGEVTQLIELDRDYPVGFENWQVRKK